MADDPKQPRPDWYRLQSADAKGRPRPLSELAVGPGTPGLKPIAHPENHDGLDLSQLPPMREAVLTEEDVRQLFSDIEALATDVLLMQRSSPRSNAAASRANSSENLTTAKDALLSGGVRRLQLRYNWHNRAWIDTLEQRPEGIRLVRIAH